MRTFNAGHVPTPVTAAGSSALRGGVDPGDVAHRGCPSPAQHDWDTPYWPVGLRCLISHSTPRIRQTSFNDETPRSRLRRALASPLGTRTSSSARAVATSCSRAMSSARLSSSMMTTLGRRLALRHGAVQRRHRFLAARRPQRADIRRITVASPTAGTMGTEVLRRSASVGGSHTRIREPRAVLVERSRPGGLVPDPDRGVATTRRRRGRTGIGAA